MTIDFSKLDDSDAFDTEVSPRTLFDLLPDKDREKYKYPRDVQSEVMDQWLARRDEPNLLVKMNTGGGKTVVGLLLLKSSLNEGKGPAVYVSPTPYLAQQVTAEAKGLGLEVTEDPRSPKFTNGRAILVTYIHRVVNGKSVFGVGDEGIKIAIGTVIIDDAHACLETSEMQFSLTAPSGRLVYDTLFALFKEELSRQSESRFLDVRDHHPDKVMEVPYWAWIDRHSEVAAALHAAKDEEDVKFIWPLIRDHLPLCRCVFGAGEVEITPRCLPITAIPSLGAAKRRIFMSATFSDDSVLVSDFDVPAAAIMKAIAPTRASDLGDRMILVPQAFNPEITDADVKKLVKELAAKRNAVVIVPSDHRAAFWTDVADLTLHARNLAEGVQKLKAGHVGLVVLVNKYDGIDLPGDACRVLVIDGVPDVRKKVDRVDEPALWGSDRPVRRAVQRIEQGMGRGVRDIEDYCLVFLMGLSLVEALRGARDRTVYARHARPAPRLREDRQAVAGRLDRRRPPGCAPVPQAGQGVGRGEPQRPYNKDVKHETGRAVDAVAQAQRAAFNAASIRDYRAAVITMEAVANAEKNDRVHGWLKQEVASYEHFRNPTQSQHILKSAIRLNPQVLHPVEGIEYERLSPLTVDQATGCIQYLRSTYKDSNEFVLDVKALLEDLIFKPGTSNRFEQAVADVATLLGFRSQRPENDTGRGPDVLWSTGGLFLVIECKNGAVGTTINKHDCDQLGGSIRWFESKYDATCRRTPVIVHPVNVFEHHGAPPPDARVATAEKLEQLKEAVRQFASSLARLHNFGREEEVSAMLAHHKLAANLFAGAYTVKYRVERSA